MKIRGIFSLLVLFALTAATVAQTNSTEREVRDLEAQYQKAAQENDQTFLERHLAPGYMSIQPDGAMQDGATLIAARKAHSYQITSYKVVEQKVEVAGDTAVVSECMFIDYSLAGVSKKGEYGVSRVWQRQPGGWKVLLLQITPRTKGCGPK